MSGWCAHDVDYCFRNRSLSRGIGRFARTRTSQTMLSGSNIPASKQRFESPCFCVAKVAKLLADFDGRILNVDEDISSEQVEEDEFSNTQGETQKANSAPNPTSVVSYQRFEIKDLDPTRYLSPPAPPPKLHFTTLWRRLTRHLYQKHIQSLKTAPRGLIH